MLPSRFDPGAGLHRGGWGVHDEVRDLQRALRQLGYLAKGIDGIFGSSTERALRALQHDLLHNLGRGPDGESPVRVSDYNRGRVSEVNGVFDSALAGVVAEMLADTRFVKVPESADPVADNARVLHALEGMRSAGVPAPFLVAVLRQESGLRHFSTPSKGDEDRFVVVGLDRNGTSSAVVTSRGYGVGQYTLFHHPPTETESREYIQDALGNVQQTVAKLKEKLVRFVNGKTRGTRADDRQAEIGEGPLRYCRYLPDDPRYMSDCRDCLTGAGPTEVTLKPTRSHPNSVYHCVPARANIGCDWPYAVRRYNGAGVDSYHYQAQVLLHILNG